MGQTYHAQGDSVPPSMTVRQLIERLQALPDHDLPVVFRSPMYGTFGSHTAYSVDQVREESLEGRTENHDPQTVYDDETGEEYQQDGWSQTWHPWKGVVIE